MALHSVMIAAMAVTFLAFPICASGSEFLKQVPTATLLEELAVVLGDDLPGATEQRATKIEDTMRPIFKSLPKTDAGGLPWNGVRYLLHRSFVERHGWQVFGIADDGAGYAASQAPTEVVASVASPEAAALFERRHGDRGLSLHETAVLAAILETMVHDDAVARLQLAYQAAGLENDEDKGEDIAKAIDYYMLMYLLRVNHTEATAEFVTDLEKNGANSHVRKTQQWARTVQREVFGASTPELGKNFDRSVRAVEEVIDRYGRWQNYECENIKADLMAIEWNGTGRVRLQDFYEEALKGNHLLSEQRDYLKDIGALDEADPARPMVMIPNFVTSPATCLGGTRFYAVCCLNECEQLYRPLEEHIGAPEATPERILELVAQLGSSSVAAPRVLPELLTSRLQDIAADHGGRVPLHGRLFAQWMHHAFPRECPYPHLAGTTAPMRGPAWQEKMGVDFMANASQLQEHIDQCILGDFMTDAVEGTAAAVAAPELPWVHTEELQVHAKKKPRSSVASALRVVMMLASCVSMAVGMAWTAMTSSKHLVGGGAAPAKSSGSWGLMV